MPSLQLYAWCVLLSGLLVKIVLFHLHNRRLRSIMPPGPSGLPLLGNVFQLPQFQWLRFTEWSKQYGSIFSLNLAGQPMVVLNDITIAADLLDRRSHIYSDRPRFIMGSEILTGGMLIAFLAYGDFWRKMRRAAHEGFNVRASTSYQPLQEKESALLVSHMLQDPNGWDDHLKRSAASTVLSAVYGWLPIDSSADSLVGRINEMMHRVVQACLPGAFLVEIFPSMLYLPAWMATWKRKGKDFFRKDTAMFEELLDDVRNKMNSGSSTPCFAASLLEGEKKFMLNNQEAAWLAGTMFGAGAETTAAALSVFMLAMTLYPDVMHCAQAQLDAVIGRGRLPTFDDRPNLPYIEAMVKEILRWRPVGPVGLPRRSMQDDWYKGYFIPKGTIVVYNTWAMNRDPKYFPDYDEFRPERYLDSSGQLAEAISDTHSLGHFTYGTGRRICMGKDVANQALFIDIATLLWAVNIEKARDKNGEHIIPSRTDCLDEGLVVRPVPFRCNITARFIEVPSIIAAVTVPLARIDSYN